MIYFGWDLVGWGIGLLIAIGLGVLAMNEPLVAKLCFGFAALLLGIKLATIWGSKPQDLSIYVMSFLAYGMIGLALVASFQWVDRKTVTLNGEAPTREVKTVEQTPMLAVIKEPRAVRYQSFGLALGPSVATTSSTDYQSELVIPGPDRIELTISHKSGRFGPSVQTIFNNHGPSVTSKVNFSTTQVSSFSISGGFHRDATPFRVVIGESVISHNPQSFILFHFTNNQIEVGSGNNLEFLPWPKSDPSTIERWRVDLEVRGLSEPWPISLDIRWQRGKDTMELRLHSDDAPAGSY